MLFTMTMAVFMVMKKCDFDEYDYFHDYDHEGFSALMMATMMTIHLPLPPLPLCHSGFAFYSRCQSETNTL